MKGPFSKSAVIPAPLGDFQNVSFLPGMDVRSLDGARYGFAGAGIRFHPMTVPPKEQLETPTARSTTLLPKANSPYNGRLCEEELR